MTEALQDQDVLMLSVLVDDSISIAFSGNATTVIEYYNQIITSAFKYGFAPNMLLNTRLLSGAVLNNYESLATAVLLNPSNYNSAHFAGTPLYDQTLVFLEEIARKSLNLQEQGIPFRSLIVLITDSNDVHSRRSAGDVAEVVKELLDDPRHGERHGIVGIGVDDGETDYRQSLQQMGIPKELIFSDTAGYLHQ